MGAFFVSGHHWGMFAANHAIALATATQTNITIPATTGT